MKLFKWYLVLPLFMLLGAICVRMWPLTGRAAKPTGRLPVVVVANARNQIPFLNTDFGRVYFGQTVRRSVALRNDSMLKLLLGFRTTCGCTRIGLSSTALAPGARSVLTLKYTEIADGVTTHSAPQSFVVYNKTGGAKDAILLRGKVAGISERSFLFSRDTVRWMFAPGGRAGFTENLSARNLTAFPASLAWAADGRGAFFSVRPARAEIAPGQSVRFAFRLNKNAASFRRPATGEVSVLGVLRSPRGQVPLKFTFPVTASPEPVLHAEPGALVLSVGTSVVRVVRHVCLVTANGLDPEPRILGASSTDQRMKVTLVGDTLRIVLRLPQADQFCQGNAVVSFSYRGTKQRVDIPVFAIR